MERLTMKPAVQMFIDRVEGHYRSIKEENPDAFLIWPPETSYEEIGKVLQDVLLPDNYVIVDPVTGGQARTIILQDLLYKLYRPYRKYIKAQRKRR